MNSWGVYIVASLALVLVLAPLLTGTVRGSREGADWREADGVRAVLDGLRPGVSLNFSFGDALTSDKIQLHGKVISCNYGEGTISLSSKWSLPDFTLLPTVRYVAFLSGTQVRVSQAG